MKLISNRHFVTVNKQYATVHVSIELFAYEFNYAFLYSVVHISIQQLTFSFKKVYDNIYDMYGPQNLPRLYKDFFTRQKLIKARGKEEWQMTGMAVSLRVGLQLCDWVKH